MLCEWDLAQMLAGSLGLKFFNVQLMHKIHSLSLPRLAYLELSRWEYFYMTVVSWVSLAWPLPTVLSAVDAAPITTTAQLCLQNHQTRVPTALGHSAGSSSFLGFQRDSLGQGQHPIPLVSSGKIGE